MPYRQSMTRGSHAMNRVGGCPRDESPGARHPQQPACAGRTRLPGAFRRRELQRGAREHLRERDVRPRGRSAGGSGPTCTTSSMWVPSGCPPCASGWTTCRCCWPTSSKTPPGGRACRRCRGGRSSSASARAEPGRGCARAPDIARAGARGDGTRLHRRGAAAFGWPGGRRGGAARAFAQDPLRQAPPPSDPVAPLLANRQRRRAGRRAWPDCSGVAARAPSVQIPGSCALGDKVSATALRDTAPSDPPHLSGLGRFDHGVEHVVRP